MIEYLLISYGFMFLVLLYSLFKGKDGMFKMFIIAPISFPILIVTMSVEWAVK